METEAEVHTTCEECYTIRVGLREYIVALCPKHTATDVLLEALKPFAAPSVGDMAPPTEPPTEDAVWALLRLSDIARAHAAIAKAELKP